MLSFLFSVKTSAQVNLIPKPWTYHQEKGAFTIDENTTIFSHPKDSVVANRLQTELYHELSFKLATTTIIDSTNYKNQSIVISRQPIFTNPDEYAIQVYEKYIWVQASADQSFGHATQTLKQLIALHGTNIQACFIQDGPRFKHRGLLLDCSRHFFSVATVKKYIDLLAFYKMNTLHWHLTEDQGWRIQIDQYPKLIEIGAWRTEKDGSRYGGFYTKEDIKEVVAYAEARNITIIPEIELPGHSQAAIAAYPHLSCTGHSSKVANDWGVFKEIYCAGNDSVFTFLVDVLTEVLELFPSKYIHIGGDEAPKYRWEHCDKCQKRMADEGLKDEYELQSYFIKRIERFLNANGRKLIGWDEILEGGLSPNATVQSWRGMEHGKHAAQMKHHVVMSPTSHCYLDYGLEAINLEKVYRFNPIPQGLEKEFEQYILGAEVNMWTEHVPNDSVLDSRVFPRLIAMAEILWSGPRLHEVSAETKPGDDFNDFYHRLQTHYPLLEKMGVQYGLEAEPVSVSTFTEKSKTFVQLHPGLPNLTLEYANGDGLAYPYKTPFELTQNTDLEVLAFKNKALYGEVYKTTLCHHKALGIVPKYNTIFSNFYTAGGNRGLTDGLTGSINFRDGRWQGFSGKNLNIELDLKSNQKITTINMQFYQDPNAWIMLPKKVLVQISEDGKSWEIVPGVILKNHAQDHPAKQEIKKVAISVRTRTKPRYIKITAENYGTLPEWHEAAGSDAWIFVDEIIVK